MNKMNSFFNLHAPNDATAHPAARNIRVANPTGPRELVMIVEDEDFIAMLAGRTLTQEGYRVIIARDGFQAVEIFQEMRGQIDLVLLDFAMPHKDGGQVFNELREIDPAIPVLLNSGVTSAASLKKQLAKGGCAFIPKPLARNKLLFHINLLLTASRKERAAASGRSEKPATPREVALALGAC